MGKKKKKKKEEKEKDLKVKNYYMDRIFENSDGSKTVIAEYYDFYVTTSTYTDSQGNMNTRTTYHYVYNDLIVAKISPSNTFEWVNIVPKRTTQYK